MSTLVYSKYDDRILTVLDPNDTGAPVSGTLPFTGTFTYATLPPASANAGKTALLSDVGPNGSMWISNGVSWTPVNGQLVLGQSGIPTIVPPNGTVAANGIVTLSSVLPVIFPNAWIYLPAGAVSGGAAGLYFCKFTSNTAGQVYNSYNAGTVSFVPTIPTPLVAAVGSGAAYTTPITTDLPVGAIALPAGIMGLNSAIEVAALFSWTVGAARSNKFFLGTFAFFDNPAATSNAALQALAYIRNRGVANSQISQFSQGPVGGLGVSTQLNALSAIDTAVAQALKFTSRIDASTAYSIIEGFTVKLTSV